MSLHSELEDLRKQAAMKHRPSGRRPHRSANESAGSPPRSINPPYDEVPKARAHAFSSESSRNTTRQPRSNHQTTPAHAPRLSQRTQPRASRWDEDKHDAQTIFNQYFHSSGFRGYRIIPTPSSFDGKYQQCGVLALAKSFKAQYPGLVQLTPERFYALKPYSEVTCDRNYANYELSSIVQLHGQRIGVQLRLGFIGDGIEPGICPADEDMDDGGKYHIVWIHNDNAAGKWAAEGNHWSGIEPVRSH